MLLFVAACCAACMYVCQWRCVVVWPFRGSGCVVIMGIVWLRQHEGDGRESGDSGD